MNLRPSSLSREKWNVAILVLLQATIGAQLPMIFIVSGLAGQSLASNVCWATLPISLIVFGSMTTAPWMSILMQKFGRKVGFYFGCVGGICGGMIGTIALYEASFALLLLSSYCTGIFMSANGFMRFAATDTASPEFRPKAISYVMAGGLAAAVIGPQLVKLSYEQFAVPFMGTFIAVVGVNIVGGVLYPILDIPKPEPPHFGQAKAASYLELLSNPKIVVSIICAMVSYALMNLIMTSTPLAVVGCGFNAGNAADVVSAHVLAMFAPSFFTGHLISRFGAERIVSVGLALLAVAGVVGLTGVDLENFFGALILLGLGWNFGFIGATNMLVSAHELKDRGKVQGLNDMMVFGCVTIASLASGMLMNCSGGTAIEGWVSVNWAMAPFLALAGGALIWLNIRTRLT